MWHCVYADLPASLLPDEIIRLGTLLRHSEYPDETPRADVDAMNRTLDEVVPGMIHTREDGNSVLWMLQRTQLTFVDVIGSLSVVVQPSCIR